MLPHSLPSDISQRRLAQAFVKVGFELNMKGGKGGHWKLINPQNGQFITLQSKIFKEVLKSKLRQAEAWGYDATEIMKHY